MEYVLVMSKNDDVCRHMLKLYDEDKKYSEIKYAQHEEFKAIKWKNREYSFGILDVNDIVFSQLKVWQDIDGDGCSSTDEQQKDSVERVAGSVEGRNKTDYRDSELNALRSTLLLLISIRQWQGTLQIYSNSSLSSLLQLLITISYDGTCCKMSIKH